MLRSTADPSSLRIDPVTPGNVADLDRLFARGNPKSCQCAWMRLTNRDYAATDVGGRRARHHAAVVAAHADDRAAGLIAYLDDEPVGWVSFDQRSAYDRLSGPLLGPVDDEPVWSVVCFVVAAGARRRGVASELLDATVDYARDHGVRRLESYPVDTTAGAPKASADLWRGVDTMFEASGFTTVEVRRQHRGAPPRPIMRRTVRPRSTR